MTEIIGVRFKSGGKEYYFDPRGVQVHVGDEVITETAKGPEFGVCSRANALVEDQTVVPPLRPMLRLATDKDRETLKANREREAKAMAVCAGKIVEHGLDMKLVRCECSFDGTKLLFFFTSEGRVDFRSLVKDLAATFHSRIELRQIGVRDESKLLGGLGICGRPFCCNAFLEQFQPVSIKMAKTQGLSLNPTKISGACGRLMCCLKYEQGAYEDAVKRLPKNESFVETPDGAGTVAGVDFLREKVKVRLEDQPDVPPQAYAPDELNVIRNGKGRRPEGYVAPPREELEKLRKTTPPPAAPVDPRRSLDGRIDAVLGGELGGRSDRRQSQRRAEPRAQRQSQPRRESKAQQPSAPKPSGEKKEGGQSRTNRRRKHRGGRGRSGGSQGGQA